MMEILFFQFQQSSFKAVNLFVPLYFQLHLWSKKSVNGLTKNSVNIMNKGLRLQRIVFIEMTIEEVVLVLRDCRGDLLKPSEILQVYVDSKFLSSVATDSNTGSENTAIWLGDKNGHVWKCLAGQLPLLAEVHGRSTVYFRWHEQSVGYCTLVLGKQHWWFKRENQDLGWGMALTSVVKTSLKRAWLWTKERKRERERNGEETLLLNLFTIVRC